MKNIKIKFNYLTIYFLFVFLLCGYIKYALYILFIVIVHEIGHVFIACLFKYKIISIEIYPFGGITKIDKTLNNRIYKDLLLAIFGIIFQIPIFLINNSLIRKYNLSIMLFNLLPILPLDGAKILFEILNSFMSYKKAIKFECIISFLGIMLYLFINYHFMLNNYLIIFLFIYKTIELINNKNIIFNKFILERYLYDNLSYKSVRNNNEIINNYQKDIKYYYFKNNKIINQSDYLRDLIDKKP